MPSRAATGCDTYSLRRTGKKTQHKQTSGSVNAKTRETSFYRDIGSGDFAHAVTENSSRDHPPGLPQGGKSHLQAEENGLCHLRVLDS